MNNKIILALLCALLLTSCASINSAYLTDASDGGLNYYMPNQDLVLTVTVVDWAKAGATNQIKFTQEQVNTLIERRILEKDAGVRARITSLITIKLSEIATAKQTLAQPDSLSIAKVEAATGAAYPDLSKTFSLEYGKNGFGKNSLDISISKSGLLSSTKSKTESQLSEALVNLARSAGSVTARVPFSRLAAGDHCPSQGKFSFSFDMSSSRPAPFKCVKQITVKIDPLNSASTPPRNGPELNKKTQVQNGVYYRQSIPYNVGIQYGSADLKKVVYSSSGSEVHLLPIKSSLFADSDANFNFVDGIPTKYTQDSGGEVVSLLKIPADVISAYFGAVGDIFDGISGNDASEIAAIKSEIQLLLAKQTAAACREAIDSKDTASIESLKCVGGD